MKTKKRQVSGKVFGALVLALAVLAPWRPAQAASDAGVEVVIQEEQDSSGAADSPFSPLFNEAMESASKLAGEVISGVSSAIEKLGDSLPQSWSDRLHSLLDRVNIHFGIGQEWTFGKSADFGPALRFKIRYDRRLEPFYRGNLTVVYDEYILPQFSLQSYDLTELLRKHVSKYAGAGVDGEVRITFGRQVEGRRWQDHLKMAVMRPYDPVQHLPYKAERIVTQLKDNDFVAFQARLNLVANLNQIKLLTSHVPLNTSAYYMMSGEYLVHVYKRPGNRARVKFIAVRGRSLGANGSLGFTWGQDLDIVGVSVVDRQFRRRLRFTPIEAAVAFPSANSAMVEYELDLNQPDVRQAYDRVIRSLLRPKALQVINPLRSEDSLKTALLVDISPLEDLFERDRNKSAGDRAVDREFRGTNDSKNGFSIRVAVGHKDLLRLHLGSTYIDNYIIATDKDGRNRRFYMPTFDRLFGVEALFGLFDAETAGTAALLFETDEKWQPKSFGELSFYLDHRDKAFSAKEARRYKDHIRKRLPKEVYDQIPWANWAQDVNRDNARLTTLLIFRPLALAEVEQSGRASDRNHLVAYLKSLPEIRAAADSSIFGCDPEMNRGALRSDLEGYFNCDLDLISQSLAVSLNPGAPVQQRISAFIRLRTNNLWQEIGPGYLASLLSQDRLEDKIYFETSWSAKGEESLYFPYGSCKNRRLYRSLSYLLAVLSDRTANIRLMDESAFPELPDKSKGDECQ